MRFGHVARAYTLARQGNADAAWTAWAEAAAISLDEEGGALDLARQDLLWLTGLEDDPEAAGAALAAASRRAQLRVAEHSGRARGIVLGVPYPNPSSGVVRVPYRLARASSVRLSVYDVLGREVAVLADEHSEAGQHEAHLNTSSLRPGTYLLRLRSSSVASTQTITVQR